MVVMPATRSSLTSRPCRVRLARSLRPRAWGGVPEDMLDPQARQGAVVSQFESRAISSRPQT